jgi:hypothetical protein
MNAYSVRYEITIDRPPHDVWRQINHFERWNPEYADATVETIEGVKDEEGQVVRIDKGFDDAFIMKVVKLVPDDQVLWAVYSAGTGVAGGVGFIDIRVEPRGEAQTVCRYSASGFVSEDPAGAFDQQAFEQAIEARLDPVLAALKTYSETA